MSEIGIIANPHSKMNKRNPKRSAMLAYILGEQGVLENTESLQHLSDVARQFYKKKIKILAINGGDGTISQTLTAFIRVYGSTPLPKICILPGGTINILAQNIGIKGSPEKVLYRLVTAHSSGKTLELVRLPSLCTHDHYGFIYADGLATRFLEKFYEKKTGRMGSLWLACKLYFGGLLRTKGFKSLVYQNSVEIHTDHKSLNLQSLLNLITPIEALPLGFLKFKLFKQPNFGSQIRGLCFTVPANDLWFKLPLSFLFKRDGKPLYSSSFQGRSIDLKGVTRYTLDGELFHNEGLKLSLSRGPMIEFIKI